MAISALPYPSTITRDSARWMKRSLWITLVTGLLTFWLSAQVRQHALVGGDGLAYFLYARSLVVDLDTNLHDEILDMNERVPADSSVIWSVNDLAEIDTDTREAELPWPIGAGLVHAPFYAAGLLGEALRAVITGSPIDTYGWIPQVFFCLGSLVFGWLGFCLTLRLVARAFPASRAIASTAAIFFAGPAVFYIFFHPSMSHAASFGLAAWLVLQFWDAWHEAPRHAFLMGLTLGLMGIIRYQNGLFGLLLIAVAIRELARSGWRPALRFASIGMLGCALPLLLQLWHVEVNSLEGPASVSSEGGVVATRFRAIDLTAPHAWDALWSSNHGAFTWTPVLLLGTLGVLIAALRHGWARLALLLLAINVYLIGTTEQWWGGSSFGMRYLIELTPFFALGLATLLTSVLGEGTPRPVWRWTTWGSLGVLILWNLLLIAAFGLETIPHSDPVPFAAMAEGVGEVFTRIAEVLTH
ncbi:MAG: hypothetical protein RL885_25915 [Planctomycetota bacterium]